MSSPKQTEIDQLAALMAGESYVAPVGAQLLLESDSSSLLLHKAPGSRTIVFKPRQIEKGGHDMVGHIQMIPDVDMSTMKATGDKFHAYAWRDDKRSAGGKTKKRLGKFDSHDQAVDAIKKFHKL